ncbi:MAG: hypothetical protein LBG48_04455 [Rickettsiales bacterium]|jgi:hypothetical protein|nr:hypothetical protein [Rickettsiales bacterium]
MNADNRTFIFSSYHFDGQKKLLSLKYSFDDEYYFEEKIEFLGSETPLTDEHLSALDRVFKYLHLICGISYYKLFIPPTIKINTFTLNEEEAKFFDNFYLRGLGEFSYRNNITDMEKRIKFPFKKNIINHALKYKLTDRKFIAVGGGKDSIVSIEILKKYYEELALISVNAVAPIRNTMKISGLKSFQIERTISKNIIELSKTMGYNGHVPISGILAFIFLAAGIIYDFDTVILSNEKSANIGNVVFCGKTINHQWSKSFEFEKLFNEFCGKFIIESFNYVSFLRPLSEICIARLFSKYKQYHGAFTSCNHAFKIENRIENWCCDCDKCRFVFLILSVFINKKELINIFGKNLFEDKSQLNGYRELCGLRSFKPFECVGEIKESVYAILRTKDDFKNDYIVKEIRKELEGVELNKIDEDIFKLTENNNLLSKELFNILKKETAGFF